MTGSNSPVRYPERMTLSSISTLIASNSITILLLVARISTSKRVPSLGFILVIILPTESLELKFFPSNDSSVLPTMYIVPEESKSKQLASANVP